MNKLTRLAEFDEALKDYEVSQHGADVLSRTDLVLLLAPSSSGRNTIISRLMKTGNYYFIVSDTTRKPRSNNGVMEQNGREYWFRSEDEVLDDISSGEFLEAEVVHSQQVSGVSIRELEKAADEGKHAITDIDIGGVLSILKRKPDTKMFIVLPPSFEEWQRRIAGRGEMTKRDYDYRMVTAERIFRYAKNHPELRLIVNDDLNHAVETLDQNVNGEFMASVQRQAEVVAILEDLHQKTKEYLATIS